MENNSWGRVQYQGYQYETYGGKIDHGIAATSVLSFYNSTNAPYWYLTYLLSTLYINYP